MEKPLGIEEHCNLRKDWVIQWYGLATCIFAVVCYIGEKWYYTTNCRRKVKKLPLGADETKGANYISIHKMLSRC